MIMNSLHDGAEDITLNKAEIRRAVLASIIGNGLEWFDFIVIGAFVHYIAEAYFPSHSPGVSILKTLGAFAVGFLVRPFGGILLGFYADRRRNHAKLCSNWYSGADYLCFCPGVAGFICWW